MLHSIFTHDPPDDPVIGEYRNIRGWAYASGTKYMNTRYSLHHQFIQPHHSQDAINSTFRGRVSLAALPHILITLDEIFGLDFLITDSLYIEFH